MNEVDVTRLIEDYRPRDLSASQAELGPDAGKITWTNALKAAEPPLIMDNEDAAEWLVGFGAWDRDEIAAWSKQELDALILQFAAGDLREVQALCPGDGLGDVDWNEAEKLSQEGTISGRLFVHEDKLFLQIGD